MAAFANFESFGHRIASHLAYIGPFVVLIGFGFYYQQVVTLSVAFAGFLAVVLWGSITEFKHGSLFASVSKKILADTEKQARN